MMLALLMLLFGSLWILTGLALFGSALWLLVSLGRSPLALRIGGTAVVVSGAILGRLRP